VIGFAGGDHVCGGGRRGSCKKRQRRLADPFWLCSCSIRGRSQLDARGGAWMNVARYRALFNYDSFARERHGRLTNILARPSYYLPRFSHTALRMGLDCCCESLALRFPIRWEGLRRAALLLRRRWDSGLGASWPSASWGIVATLLIPRLDGDQKVGPWYIQTRFYHGRRLVSPGFLVRGPFHRPPALGRGGGRGKKTISGRGPSWWHRRRRGPV